MINSQSHKTTAVKRAVAQSVLELEQLRQQHPALVGTPTKTLRSLTCEQLCERYWQLWSMQNPYHGIPRSWRAQRDNSPVARKTRHVRKNEMTRINKIITERHPDDWRNRIKQGQTYIRLFGEPKPIFTTKEFANHVILPVAVP